MAAGCPIIASTSGNIPRVVGRAGKLFPEDDPSALAAVLDDVLSDRDERGELQRRGIARVGEAFEWSVRARSMAHVFQFGRLPDAARTEGV